MNCDQVFDILTRGPFPAGQPSDAAVERHLAACYECRQMADALRPAVDLIHESMSADECDQLPGYRGALSEPAQGRISLAVADAIKKPVPAKRHRAERRSQPPATSLNFYRIAAGTLLAAALCILLLGVVATGQAPVAVSGKVPMATTPASLMPGPAGHQLLVSLDIDQAHWHLTDANAIAGAKVVHCCTHCHAQAVAEVRPLSSPQFARLQRSCQACHES